MSDQEQVIQGRLFQYQLIRLLDLGQNLSHDLKKWQRSTQIQKIRKQQLEFDQEDIMGIVGNNIKMNDMKSP